MRRERIETERLVIRRPRAADVGAVFARYAADPEVTRYLGWATHQTIDDTRAFLEFCDAEWARWPAGPYMIESRADGTLVGGTGLGFETPKQATTGYVLAQDAWGKGYATETLIAMRELAGLLGVERLYALCHPEHRASWHVLEKGGFVREGILRGYAEFPNLEPGARRDVLCYSAVFRR
jgi:[ribosomal protein S5]-alanine N-acetyltransferase